MDLSDSYNLTYNKTNMFIPTSFCEPGETELFAPTVPAQKPAHEIASLSSNRFLENLRKIFELLNSKISE